MSSFSVHQEVLLTPPLKCVHPFPFLVPPEPRSPPFSLLAVDGSAVPPGVLAVTLPQFRAFSADPSSRSLHWIVAFLSVVSRIRDACCASSRSCASLRAPSVSSPASLTSLLLPGPGSRAWNAPTSPAPHQVVPDSSVSCVKHHLAREAFFDYPCLSSFPQVLHHRAIIPLFYLLFFSSKTPSSWN